MRVVTLKPEFWSSEELASIPSVEARLLYIGLLDCSEGKSFSGIAYLHPKELKLLKERFFPLDVDVTEAHVLLFLKQLEKAGMVVMLDTDPLLRVIALEGVTVNDIDPKDPRYVGMGHGQLRRVANA